MLIRLLPLLMRFTAVLAVLCAALIAIAQGVGTARLLDAGRTLAVWLTHDSGVRRGLNWSPDGTRLRTNPPGADAHPLRVVIFAVAKSPAGVVSLRGRQAHRAPPSRGLK